MKKILKMKKVIVLLFIFSQCPLSSQNGKVLKYKFEKPVGSIINVYEKNRYELLNEVDESKFKSAWVETISDTINSLNILARDGTILYRDISPWDTYLMNERVKRSKDSLYSVWKRRKNFFFSRVHILMGIGRPLKMRGDMWDVYRKNYGMGRKGSLFLDAFGGAPEMHNKSNRINLGIAVNVTPVLSVGLWMLPSDHKCYAGGSGTNITYNGWLFENTDYGKGVRVLEEITSKSWLLDLDWQFLQRKRLSYISLNASAGVGIFLNQMNVKTSLWAYDLISVYDSTSTTYKTKAVSEQRDFSQEEKTFGLLFHLDLNLYFGDYFSVFSRTTIGRGSAVNITEKRVTCQTQTAIAPAHSEYVGGFGETIGIACHFGKSRSKNRTPK